MIEVISKKDVFESDANTYMTLSLEKWKLFIEDLIQSDRVVVLESSIFQVQINALKDKVDFHVIKKFINNLVDIIKPCNPSLIYFYQNSTDLALERAIKVKGEHWFNNVFNGQSFNEVAKWLNRRKEFEYELYNELNIRKMIIENSKSNWLDYEKQILDYLAISYIPDSAIKGPDISEFTDIYVSDKYDDQYARKYDLIINNGYLYDRESQKVLIRKDELSFYKQGLPTELKFDFDNGKIKKFSIIGKSVPEENIPGSCFYKL